MRIITESRLTAFWAEHPPAEMPLRNWRAIIRRAEFQSPHELKAQFSSVDFLGGGVVVFDLGGNKYRLVATMRYERQIVYIHHVLTHAEYDRRSRSGDL